jgi:polysaccharide export outer membrane protein
MVVTERAELYAVDEGSLKEKMIKNIVMASAVLILFIDAPTLFSEATTPPSFQNQLSAYVLGPLDVITIQALDVDEISNKPIWIDTSGFINLSLVGRLKAADLTLQELEMELNSRLKAFVKEPHCVVTISEFRSQPVSVLGMVTTPGVHQVQGRKALLEVLSVAGGIRPEAGTVAKVTRRLEYGQIPLPGATTDASGQFSVAEVHLKALMEGRSPEENIQVRPHDVILVPKADILYVIGEVRKAGGFVIRERRRTTVIEVIAMAEGMLPEANRKKAELLRLVPGKDDRSKIELKLDKILSGKEADVALQAEDILIISPSVMKGIKRRIGETALSVITSVAIYGGL